MVSSDQWGGCGESKIAFRTDSRQGREKDFGRRDQKETDFRDECCFAGEKASGKTLIQCPYFFTSEAEVVNLEQPLKEEWQVLCEQISVEHDSERLMTLIEELNRVLVAKDQQPQAKKSDAGNAA